MVLISWYAWSCRQLQAVSHLSLKKYIGIKVHGLSTKSSAEAGIRSLKYKLSSFMVGTNSCYSSWIAERQIAASHFYSNLRSHEGDLLSKTRRILSHYKLNTWYFKSLRSWILYMEEGKSTNVYEGNSKGTLQKTTVNGRFKIRSTIAKSMVDWTILYFAQRKSNVHPF